MSRRKRPELSLSVIEDLKRKGFNQSQIALMFPSPVRAGPVSRQAVSYHKNRYGGTMTPREIVGQHWPFKVPAEMSQTAPYKRLRDHGEYFATGGKGMSRDQLNRLRAFYRKLRDEGLVVEFDPAIPPIPGVSNKGGWAYRPRKPKDDDLLIRVNEHTHLTEYGKRIWRFPPTDP